MFGGRASVRRGNVRHAILAVLRDEPMHGYQIIQELESRTAGRWRPSAGSVYPTLQQLEDERLVRGEEVDGRRTYTLTDTGQQAAADSPLAGHPWIGDDPQGEPGLRRLGMQLVAAAVQVQREGSPEAHRRAEEVLSEGRRELYRLLAEDVAEPVPDGASDGKEKP
jgi:DNA-binding PadR family transcriptional regulator